jgi:hypothetical protein
MPSKASQLESQKAQYQRMKASGGLLVRRFESTEFFGGFPVML